MLAGLLAALCTAGSSAQRQLVALALDGVSRLGPVVRRAAGAGLGAGAADLGATTAAMTEGGGADAATLPVDAVSPVDASAAAEGEGATTATPPADADAATESPGDGRDDDGPGEDGANAATRPVESGSASEAGEAASAAPPVDAVAAPAAADGSTFLSSFTRIVDVLKASKLGQRARCSAGIGADDLSGLSEPSVCDALRTHGDVGG